MSWLLSMVRQASFQIRVSPGIRPGGESGNAGTCGIFSFVRNVSRLFSIVAAPLYTPHQQCRTGPSPAHSLQHLLFADFWMAILTRVMDQKF